MKFEVGQQVEVLGDWEHMNHPFPIGAIVQVMNYNPLSGTVTCKGCIQTTISWIHEKDLKPYNKKEETMKQMKEAVLAVAKNLAKANNTVTTLEIKTELRRDYPYYYWTQQVVSDYMSQFAGDGIFTYTDNGTYRVYSLTSAKQQAATAGPVSKSLGGGTISTGALGGVTASRKRNAPKKRLPISSPARVARNSVPGLAKDSYFESFTIQGIGVVTRADIKNQKKSPTGYLTSTKLNKVSQITVAGKTYQVV